MPEVWAHHRHRLQAAPATRTAPYAAGAVHGAEVNTMEMLRAYWAAEHVAARVLACLTLRPWRPDVVFWRALARFQP